MLLFNPQIPGVISDDPSQAERDFQRRWAEAQRRFPGDPRAQGQLMDDWQFGREVFSETPPPQYGTGGDYLQRLWEWFSRPGPRIGIAPVGTPPEGLSNKLSPGYWLYRGAYVGVGAILLILGLASLVFVKSGSLRPEMQFSPVAKADIGGS